MQKRNRGAAMVEFALVVPFFFMLLMSIVYGALVMHDINSLNEITRNAVRYGSVIDSGISFDDKKTAMVNFVKDKANGTLVLYRVKYGTQVEVVDSEINIGNSSSGSSFKDQSIKLTVTAQMVDDMPKLFMDYFPKDLKTIKSELTMRRED